MVSVLEKEPGFEVVGQGGSADEAIRLSQNLQPDLILLDMDMPVNGVHIARNIAFHNPIPRFVFLTISGREDCPVRFFTTGERAYILQNVASQDLFRILKALHSGESYLPPALAASILCENSEYEPSPQKERGRRIELTGLEQHILRDMAAGLSIPEVGLDLRLPERLIKQSIARILRKRRVRSRFDNILILRSGKTVKGDSYMAIEIGKKEL